ncbi:MAG TPA: LCP family protein [Micromonosporaceae bacterium]|nr:LCP family protein [Micromonosporaceae bacterium]
MTDQPHPPAGGPSARGHVYGQRSRRRAEPPIGATSGPVDGAAAVAPVKTRPGGVPRQRSLRRRRRSPIWTKLAVAFGALLMVGGGTGVIAVLFLVNSVNASVRTVDLLGGSGAGRNIDGAINMLMVGLDTRAKNPGLGSRSDSIIIAHVPATHDRVFLISIPRDTSAQIPAFPATKFGGGSFKINAAFFYGSQNGGGNSGGMQLLAMTLKNLTGLSFDSGLIVNFDGFSDIVTKLGGVDMYVDERTQSLHHGYITGHPNEHAAPWVINPDGTPNHRVPGTTPVIYTVGQHHFNAYDALDYVRCRDFLKYTDYDRQRHQQQFIKALLVQAYQKGISDPLRISSFLGSLGKAFTFDPGQAASGRVRTLSDWVFTLKGINPGSMVAIKTNGGVFVPYTGPAPDDRQALSDDSLTLLHDVGADRVDDFLATHPSWIAQS